METTTLTPRRRWFLVSVMSVLILALAFHSLMLVLYNSRPNPVKLRHATLINTYIHPLFTQDWHLFSPSPVNFDVILLLKSRVRERATGRVTETRWMDITTPILKNLHRNRLSSLGSLAHIHVYTMFARSLGPADSELAAMICREDSSNPICKGESPSHKAARARADRLTARVASAHAFKLYANNYDILEVKVRTVVMWVPRFSRRYDPMNSGRATHADSSWMRYEPIVPFS